MLEINAGRLFAVRFPTGTGSFALAFARKRGGEKVIRIIASYFKDPAAKPNFKMDLSGYTPFEKKVYRVLCRVPAGKVITYGELAKRSGHPGAARAVGNAMRKNRLPVVIPCHRVICSDGSLGQYSAGLKWKRCLLRHEGNSCV